MTLIVTGGAGFIGSSFLRKALAEGAKVVCVDKLTYAGHLENLTEINKHPGFRFAQGDICDFNFMTQVYAEHKPTALVNFAAESHVDNSIHGPAVFIQTNVQGTMNLLEVTRSQMTKLAPDFKFVHVSTDEVFGELGPTGFFSETTPYDPSSPYSASKACSDHLVRAWQRTYGIQGIVTNCSNNYGPRQFPEKLIPRMIRSALSGKKLPVYGQGQNIRDWIHVEDHCQGVWLATTKGQTGETYCFGGNSERTNLDVVEKICTLLDELAPRAGHSHKENIEFVTDRLGHDFRYAIDDSHAQKDLNFQRKYKNFEDGLRETVQWYLQNQEWVTSVTRSQT